MEIWECNIEAWGDRKLENLVRRKARRGTNSVVVVAAEGSPYYQLMGYVMNSYRGHLALEIPMSERHAIKVLVEATQTKEVG